ncbi:alpha-glucosidase [Clostridium sp. DL1XJH146]
MQMKIIREENKISLQYKGRIIFEHKKNKPIISVGYGKAVYKMKRGSFKVSEKEVEKFLLTEVEVVKEDSEVILKFYDESNHKLLIKLFEEDDRLNMSFETKDTFNRLWLNISSSSKEHFYGCGEQYLKFDLKGEKVNIWVSEHVSLSGILKKHFKKKLKIEYKPEEFKYAKSYYAQPTFISSGKYFCHVEDDSFMRFDFSKDNEVELNIWNIPSKIIIGIEENYCDLLENMTGLLGRQPKLPQWVYDGVILGIQDGTETVLEKINKVKEKEVPISGVWCQDWEGQKITSFGKQLRWNWQWDEKLYPNLDKEIKNLKDQGIHFLGYINPFLVQNGDLYNIADKKGYLVKNQKRENYLVKSTTFYAGMIDLTNPDAYEWIKNIIKKNMIEFGLSGWMADFGEYLPADAVVYNNVQGENVHNIWPVLWAKVNREAIEEEGKLGEVFFFTRAGYNGTQKYSTLMWTGDQHVDWSRDYGLPCVLPAQLSLSMSGFGLCHSDIGGYTTLLSMKRSKELLLRWIEMNAFTPVMRSHEGNKPERNYQFDSDDEILEHLARMGRVYTGLGPYIKELVELNSEKGIPAIRPLFFHYYDDEKTFDKQWEYLFGRDLLVAPVYEEGKTTRKLYLPKDEWIYLWSDKEYSGGEEIIVEALIGYPAVFYRKKSEFNELFKGVGNI